MSTQLADESNKIIDYLTSIPKLGKTTCTKEVLQNILLGTEGWIMAQGKIWDFKSKHLGVGIYEIHLEERK